MRGTRAVPKLGPVCGLLQSWCKMWRRFERSVGWMLPSVTHKATDTPASDMSETTGHIFQYHMRHQGRVLQTNCSTAGIPCFKNKPMEAKECHCLDWAHVCRDGITCCVNQHFAYLLCGYTGSVLWSTPTFTGLAAMSFRYPAPDGVCWLDLTFASP